MMNWSSWADFAAMGGYGFYVWGSFGAAAAVIAGELWTLAARRKGATQARHDAGQPAIPRDFSGDFSEKPHEA